jgi:hypothetical protein
VIPLRGLLRQFISTTLMLGAIGGLAIGASGLIAEFVLLTAGLRVLAGVAPGQALSASDCARWLAGTRPRTTAR